MPWTLLPFLVACRSEEEPADPCLPGPDPTLEIGDGDYGYVAVPPGGELPIVHGPQGGYHTPIGLLATGVDGSDIVAAHVEIAVGGEVLASVDPWLQLECEPEQGGLVAWGMLLVYGVQPAEIDGQTASVGATLTDAAGVEVSVTEDFVLRDRP